MDVATTDTHLTIEDLLQGYDSLIEDMDMFYDKLDPQLVFNLINKFRYRKPKKDRVSKIYGPPEFPNKYTLTYQDIGNMRRMYQNYCQDMDQKHNGDIAYDLDRINDNSMIDDYIPFIKRVLERYESCNKKNLTPFMNIFYYILKNHIKKIMETIIHF